jgi:Flp pilus assembly protein TadB
VSPLTLALAWGALVGLGGWWAWTGWAPSVEPLARSLARFGQAKIQLEKDGRPDLDARFARQIRKISLVERQLERQRMDLRIVDRTPDEQATMIGAYALLGFFVGSLLVALRLLGMPIPVLVAGWGSVLGALGGAVLPMVDLRDQAVKRRKAFAHALSGYCVFVDMSMASGLGVEQSLETAAASGDGWQFAELRGALASGRLRDITPWQALAQLGEETGISDLRELAGAVSLAGEEGAAVRETVAGKARTIRERITADAEQAASRVTVRMAMPASLMLLGFMVLLGYPAAKAVFGEFG